MTLLPIFLTPFTARIWGNCELKPHQKYLESGNVQVFKGRKRLLEMKEGRDVRLIYRTHVCYRILQGEGKA